jgi:hypothetical protein
MGPKQQVSHRQDSLLAALNLFGAGKRKQVKDFNTDQSSLASSNPAG